MELAGPGSEHEQQEQGTAVRGHDWLRVSDLRQRSIAYPPFSLISPGDTTQENKRPRVGSVCSRQREQKSHSGSSKVDITEIKTQNTKCEKQKALSV